jgi:hypothetical protein
MCDTERTISQRTEQREQVWVLPDVIVCHTLTVSASTCGHKPPPPTNSIINDYTERRQKWQKAHTDQMYPGVLSVIDHDKQIVNVDFDDGDKAVGSPENDQNPPQLALNFFSVFLGKKTN